MRWITSTRQIRVMEFDPAEAIAWKNGYFRFNGTSLESILRQLSRWYGVHVDYSELPTLHFSGFISRDNNISEVLDMLELTGGIRFRIGADRQIFVEPGAEDGS